jgi:hypothetical protein
METESRGKSTSCSNGVRGHLEDRERVCAGSEAETAVV